MSKRNAIRLGSNPHAAESVAFTVRRYGAIKPETLAAIKEYMDSPEGRAERTYEIYNETISDMYESEVFQYPVIKTIRKGSALYKIIDNEHDAQNTLANIRNANFPRNKQRV
jgi:hypothetical protein